MIPIRNLATIVAVMVSAAAHGQSGSMQTDDYRTWTDATGRFTVHAVLVGFSDGKVHLRKRDGAVVRVSVGKLSKADQQHVRNEVVQRRGQASSATGQKQPALGDAANWPGWRGPLRDGKSPDTGLLKEWPAEGPPLLWHATGLGGGFSTVAVVDGVVYTTGVVGKDLVLFAFDMQGKLKWRVSHGPAHSKSHPGARSTPTIDEGYLHIVSGGGLVGCYDAAKGGRKWTRTLAEFGGKTPGWAYAESVLIYNDLAVVTPGGENCIVALKKGTGEPVWSTQGFSAGAQYGSCYAFEHGGVPMIAAGTREGLVCVEADSGRVLWSNAFSAGNTANCPTPVYSDGHVFWANGYGKGGICLKLDVAGKNVTADVAWTTRDMNCHHGGYIIDDGYIYGNHSSGWVCLDLRTGEKQWQERGVGKGSVCYADGMLYLFSENRGRAGLATCSPQGFEMRGEFSVEGEGKSWAHPVVIGGRLYLRYDDNLYCFDVRA